MTNQMASFDVVQNSSRGGSKAQICLHKILHIISTIPPDHEATCKPPSFNYVCKASEHNTTNEYDTGLDIDLNISVQELSTTSTAVPTGVEEKLEVVEEKKAEDGFMGLLIEAARLIFGEFKDEDDDDNKQSLRSDESSKKRFKRNKNALWMADLCEEIAGASRPVVRSKRERVQVLPCKYRDSVVEPLTPFSRKRSLMVGNKRKSR